MNIRTPILAPRTSALAARVGNWLRAEWRRKIIKDAVALYAGKGVNLSLGIVSTLVYGIVFASREIAVITLFEMISALVVSFGFTWSAFGIVRFGREEHLENERLNQTSSVRLGIMLPLLFLSILLLLVFRNPLLGYIGSEDATLIGFLICETVLVVLHEHITHIFTAVERHSQNALFFLLQSLGKLAVLIIFYFGVTKVSAEFYLKTQVAILLALVLMRLPFIKKKYVFPIHGLHREDFGRFLKFVLPQVYGFTGMYLINWMDVYFIRKHSSLDELGAYQFLYSIFLKICSFAFLLNALFFPKIVAWKKQNQQKLVEFLHRSPQMLFVGSGAVAAVMTLSYQPLFATFFGVKYSVAYSSFNILLCAVPFFFLTYLFVPVLNSHDRVGYIQVANLVSASVNLCIDFLFIPRFGIIAAAVGTFLAYVTKCVMLMMAVSGLFSVRHNLLAISGLIFFLLVVLYAI